MSVEKSVEISVVIPVYNVCKYLQACIDSLMNQTMDSIEYIFVNDASTDNCLQILEENRRKYPNKIKVIDSPDNLKQGGAKNLGIKYSSGKYIGFCDSDDIISPTMYEKLYCKAEETNADVTYMQYARIGEYDGLNSDGFEKPVVPIISWKEEIKRLDGRGLTDKGRELLMCSPIGGLVCGLWRKSFLDKIRVSFPEHLRYEDNYWGTLVYAYAEKIAFIEEIGYYYRLNPYSTVRAQNQEYQYDRIIIENSLLSEMKERNLYERYHDALEYIYTIRYARNSFKTYVRRFDVPNKEKYMHVINDLKQEFPNWKKNPYYNANTHILQKINDELFINHTKAYILIFENKLIREFRKFIKCILKNILGRKS